MPAPEGTAVRAVLPGRVVLSRPSGHWHGYGDLVVLEHRPWGLWTLYAHLSRRAVREGQDVAQGQPIGAVGRTAGTAEDPQRVMANSPAHLHLELLTRFPPPKRDQDRQNPAALIAICEGQSSNHRAPGKAPWSWEGHPTSTPARYRPRYSGGGGLPALVVLYLAWRRERPFSSR